MVACCSLNSTCTLSALSLEAAFLSYFLNTTHVRYILSTCLCFSEWDLKEAKRTHMFLNRPGNSHRWKWPRFLTGKTTATTTITTATRLELISERIDRLRASAVPGITAYPTVFLLTNIFPMLRENPYSTQAIFSNITLNFYKIFLFIGMRICEKSDTWTLLLPMMLLS